jgi:hypothetical protein
MSKISAIGIPFFPPQEFLNRKKKRQANEANPLPWSRAFPRWLCVSGVRKLSAGLTIKTETKC